MEVPIFLVVLLIVVITILYFRGGTIINQVFRRNSVEADRQLLTWQVGHRSVIGTRGAIREIAAQFADLPDKPGLLAPQTYVLHADEALVFAYGARLQEWWRITVVAVPDAGSDPTLVIASIGDATTADAVLPGASELRAIQQRIEAALAVLLSASGER